MDSRYVSDLIKIMLKNGWMLEFSRIPLIPSAIPYAEEMLEEDIKGVHLSYQFCSEQDFGIIPIQRAFGATKDGIITKIPSGFTVDSASDVSILKYGNTPISPGMYGYARKFGVVGYWDQENLIFCASKKYETIIFKLIDFFTPNKVRFNPYFAGSGLLITSC